MAPTPMAGPIPRRIIQTAKRRALPLKQQAMAASLKLLHPDYDYCFFDDDDVDAFVRREFPEYRRVFDGFASNIQRFDFFRYLAVYRLGGFYFDLDVVLAHELTPLLPAGCVFPFEGLTFSRLLRRLGMDWELGNYAFGASAGHPFLAAAIDNCVTAQQQPAWLTPMLAGVPPLSRAEHRILYTTGPGLLSRTLAENPAFSTQMTVLFPDDVCDLAGWNGFGGFGVHLMEGSWRPGVGFLRRRLAQKWEARVRDSIIQQSRLLGKTRRLSADGVVSAVTNLSGIRAV
jgi:mannosyltransferase OCH1-like enzyme